VNNFLISKIKNSAWILTAAVISAHLLGGCGYFSGCNMFSNKRQEEIKEKLERLQENIDKKADSIRREQYKKLADTTFGNMDRTMDSLKRSSDSLEQLIKKDIEELKKKKTK
jgi:spore cortex formation protein SpoVR/YcgB (stage V sporulation)